MANDPCVRAIGTYVPETRIDNLKRIERFDYDPEALRDKIGIEATARMAPDQETSDLCVAAYEDLVARLGETFDPQDVDLIVVVTQHPDGHGLPHTSAIVHGKLGLPKSCFAFDISLGCSGYVSALATVKGHLWATGKSRAILFTADPYSKSVSEDDKNTAMIFGDAATATLIGPGDGWKIGTFDQGTDGKAHTALMRDAGGTLQMAGRGVFNFCALNVPKSVTATLAANGVTKEEIDAFVFHPGSKYIVDTIAARCKIPAPARLDCAAYGNTVSSSIPLVLAGLSPKEAPTVFVSGFGVGLGWSSCVLTATTKETP